MRKLTKQQLRQIEPLYNSGLTYYEIAEQFGVHNETIRWNMIKLEIPRRRRGTRRQNSLNHRYFQTIDCERKAYWLGFLAADGYILDQNNQVGLHLQHRDAAIVERFREDLECGYEVKTIHKGGRMYARLAFRSPEMIEDLAKYTVTPRKSFTLRWPDIPKPFLRHYLRGYFDGDGRLYARYCGKDYELHILWSIISNHTFVAECQKYLIKECGVNKVKPYVPKNCPSMANLNYSGGHQVRRICHLMYDDATVFLQRKFDVIAPYYDHNHPTLFEFGS